MKMGTVISRKLALASTILLSSLACVTYLGISYVSTAPGGPNGQGNQASPTSTPSQVGIGSIHNCPVATNNAVRCTSDILTINGQVYHPSPPKR